MCQKTLTTEGSMTAQRIATMSKKSRAVNATELRRLQMGGMVKDWVESVKERMEMEMVMKIDKLYLRC